MKLQATLRLGLIVFGLCALSAGRNAQAGVAVSPLKQELALRAGETGKVSIAVVNNRRNDTDESQGMHLSVMDVQVTDTGALDFKPAGTAKDSAGKWVKLEANEVTLEPAKSHVIECTVAVPAATPPGEYYAAVMVTLTRKGKNEKGLELEYRIASGIFVTVTGQTFPKQARVARTELIWPETATSRPATQPQTQPDTQPATQPDTQPATQPAVVFPKISVLLENTGKARFGASGRVTMVDAKARTVFSAKLIGSRPCIFAGDSRFFEAPLNKPLPVGKYRIKVEMDYESTWAKARQEIPIEILPASAELMAKLQTAGDGALVVEVGPDKLVATIPAGATRSLAVAVSNKADGPAKCAAKILAGGAISDAWITLAGEEFVLAKGSRKSMGVLIRVPTGTPAGKYVSTLSLGSGVEGASVSQMKIPVELDVPAER